MTASERHNRLASDYVRQVGSGTRSSTEIAVVLESIVFGTMTLMTRLYGTSPQVATAFVEAALQRAVERFTASQK